MNLLPGDIILIKRGTLWMPFAPLIWAWQKIADPSTPWSWAYHVEMVWDIDPCNAGYWAFSLQPPVLQIIGRNFNDIKFTAYRLKDRPDDLTDKFWRWGNPKLLATPYILGWSTCGHPVVEAYGLDCDPYPGSIEAYYKKSDKWIRIK